MAAKELSEAVDDIYLVSSSTESITSDSSEEELNEARPVGNYL